MNTDYTPINTKPIILIGLILMLIGVLLTGCSTGIHASTDMRDIKVRCINGVEYYLFKEHTGQLGFGFMAPKYNPDGTITLCPSVSVQ